MKRSVFSQRWLPVIFLFLFFSCKKGVAPDYLGFEGLSVGNNKGQQMVIRANLKFYNPNDFNSKLKHAEVSILINDKPAGNSVLDSTIFIGKKDTFYIPVILQIDLANMGGNLLQIAMTKEAKVTLDGKARLKKGLFGYTAPFHYEGNQKLDFLLGK